MTPPPVAVLGPVGRRRATVALLEAAGVPVVGEGRTAEDGLRLARRARLLLVDDDVDLAASLAGRARVPVVVLRRGDPAPGDPVAAGPAAPALPWPLRGADLAALPDRLLAFLGRPGGPVGDPSAADDPPAAARPRIVVLGASAGGPSALAEVLAGLGGVAVPIVVVQHLHPRFSGSLRGVLQRASAVPVVDAVDGMALRPGTAVTAVAGRDLQVGADRRLRLTPASGLDVPSIDACMRSVAAAFGSAAVGVVLTGMGSDGAAGLRAMRDRGAVTMAQDRGSSAVFGMPAAAVRGGGAAQALPLDRLAEAIRRAVGGTA